MKAGESALTTSPGGARSTDLAAPFPPGFLWGAATAAHQVEGNNVNSDYWVLEHLQPSPFAEPSGDACDSGHRFEEDIRLLAGFGLNTYRFSVEWARIEPEKGAFSRALLERYRRLAATCREQGLTPIATLHHFTSPRWLAGMNAWESGAAADLFARYAETVAQSISDLLGAVCTINEPNQPVKGSILRGSRPEPGADVVRAAATSHGTFYRYFDSKDDFFRVLAEEASGRMIELVEQLDLDAGDDGLRDWLRDWFAAYEADGGIISTWQDMRTSPELVAFSEQVAASVFTRLEQLLDQRDFGHPQVAAAMLLALLERAPYRVFVLGYSTAAGEIEATLRIIRRGFLGRDDG